MKKMTKIKKMISLCLAAMVLAFAAGETVSASELPYDTYNYDYREYIHFTPAAYVPSGTVTGGSFSYNGEPLGNFVNPQDMCQADDGSIYIADTGNNRIVVLDQKMKKVLNVITSFDNNGTEDTFNMPYGVDVSESGQVYIADSQNHRVVVLEKDGTLVKIVENPKSESLDDNYVFVPLKVTVDYADRIYVIAQNMFEGIMVFESNGSFSSFFGTIKVEITLWEKFWKRLATKEERSKQQLYIPTEFTGIDIDPSGFVYATNIDSTGVQGVRRLNPRGEDVIKKGQNKNVGGDLWISGTSDYSGPSQFMDVVYRQNGIYSCLDRKRGRIFTYDHEGNLLYIFGGLGTQEGTFFMPVAIEDIGGSIVVLDATGASIVCFEETEYGRLINEAVALRYDGDETQAVALWKRVLELDENNELANTGIGKAYLTAGDYVNAMKYLKLGMSREYYSIAYRRYRNGKLTQNANYILTGVVILIVVWQIAKRIIKKKKKGAARMGKYFSKEKWKYMLYTISHPMEGYYWIRHAERGSVPLAILMVILFAISFSANRLLASFVVNDIDPRTVDSLYELLGVLAFYLILCVSNWSVTCLMNGEGRMKDIAIAVGYGTVPITVMMVIGTIVSQVVADDEQAFYVLIIGAGIVYGIIMMLIGIMQVHNYSLGKTLLTLFITFIALLIIIFLMLLLSNLIGMVINFFKSIYTELIFRT